MSASDGSQSITRSLTAMQEIFCQEYLVDLNASQAAMRAGYSAKTASRIGPELLGKTWVAARIQALMNARAKRIERKADDVLSDLQRVKTDAMKQVIDKDGKSLMANHAGALKALELEGRHLKMFTDKMEVTGANGDAIKHTVEITYVTAKLR